MKIAIIDLGTNTFHLLILESKGQDFNEIARKRIYVKLGEESLLNQSITLEAQKRALEAMIIFREIIDLHQVTEVHAVATSAMRSVNNSQELVDLIRNKTAISVKIISGAQEAALIYRGVKEAVKINNETALIMDIGGGSVEFIICNDKESLWEESYDIGVQRLVDNFHQQDPILPENLIELEQYLNTNLKSLFEAVNTYQPIRLIGSSGAFTTVISMYAAREGILLDAESTSYNLPFDKFENIYKNIRYTNHEERLQTPGLSDQRVDMIVASTALIYFILNKTFIRTITASKYSLKVGLFFQVLESLQNN